MRQFFWQIIRAMIYCKQNKIVHRDLKPENILLDEGHTIKLTDFGFANIIQDDWGGNLKTTCGTVNYLAPEIIQQTSYDGLKTDI